MRRRHARPEAEPNQSKRKAERPAPLRPKRRKFAIDAPALTTEALEIMIETPLREPWERLTEILATGDEAAVRAFLDTLPSEETARALSRLEEAEQARLFTLLGPAQAADIVASLPDAEATEIIEDLPAAQAAAIVDELPSDEQADLLGELPQQDAEAILGQMAPDEAAHARQLLAYAPDQAGGLMITEYLSYPIGSTVGDVVRDLRDHSDQYAEYDIQYVYAVDEGGGLVGVLRLRDLLLARANEPVETLMIGEPQHASVDTGVDELKGVFEESGFVGMPVVNERGVLVGVVRRLAVEEALQVRATKNFLSVSGLAGAEELRTMPLLQRSTRRLSWLSINIGLNIIAASVIAFYQDTLSAVIALAVFLPIISDMSGCSGNQAVAVSMRELALGLVKPYEFARVFGKEAAVGVINGLALGILLGAVAGLWQGNVFLGLVVGGAMMINTVTAVVLGGVIPLVLKALRFDPALASSPILTTVTDMMGFFLVLSFATLLLTRLV